MKIALVGTHGVGKSSTLQDINHPNSITEVARELIEQGHKQGDLGFQQLVFDEQKRRENLYDSFVADRSVRDILAYTRYYSESLYQTLLAQSDNQYDYVFMIPIQFEMENDGVRIVDTQYQKDIQDILVRVLTDNNVNYTIITGDRKQRKEKIMKIIKK